MTYTHTQYGPLHWILSGLAVPLFGVAVGVPMPTVARVALFTGAGVVLLLAFCFRSLTVEDVGEALEVRFGPLPLFRTRLPYEAIAEVVPSQSSLIDGWGVHWVPGRGWTYNLWGFDCVELTVNGSTIRIGTDDPEGLVEYLRSRVGGSGAPEVA